MDADQVVELNVGGKLLTTYLSTLMNGNSSKLSEMIKRTRINGRIFIDCDGDIFRYVLNYLRNGSIPPKEKILEVHDCAESFGIKSLVDKLNLYQHVALKNTISKVNDSFNGGYDEIKRWAVAELNDNFQPGEDKYLLFDFPDILCNPIQIDGVFSYIHRLKLDTPTPFKRLQHVMHISSDGRIDMERCLRCLGHELCELGFGKYSHYSHNDSKADLECKYCGCIEYHAIILTQKQSPLERI